MKECLPTLHMMEDSQAEIALLHSCLALPKLACILRTCPPHYITQATKDFNATIRGSLESIVGSPITEWSWLKASLPSNLGGINLRSASLHAPVAYITSPHTPETLVSAILGESVDCRTHLGPMLVALSNNASQPDWTDFEDIDVPIMSMSPFTSHQQGSASPAAHHCPFNSITCPSSVHLTTPCWRLAKCSTFTSPWTASPRPGVLLLPQVLAGCPSLQLYLPLP